jgi:TonB-linked SusC/RagA family outer membrane protein
MKKKFKSNFFNIRSNCGKVCLIMRLTLVLMAASLMQIYATGYTQSARISLSLKNVSLKQALKEIEKQSDYTFVYNDSKIDVNKKVDINVKDCALVEVLDQLIADSEINYTSIDNHIVLTDKNKYIYRLPAITREAVLNREELDMETISPIKNYLLQQVTVTGKIVSSADNQPLPGVNVVVKGTTIGSTSDINGAFTLNIPDPNSTLVFSFVGYQTKEVVLSGQKELDITLVEETQELQEIVVVGYGVQKKSVVTGAISSIKADDIQSTSVSQAQQALQGKTSGVQVINGSGSPGAPMKIRIRGFASNNNSEPIYIVDGVKTTDISGLDPNDINSMEVLKDAASTAIYGAEGGNGVVMITTKSGKSGKHLVTYDFQYGIQKVGHTPELMNSQEYAEYMKEAGSIPNANTTYDTDWLGEIFEDSPMQKHHLSFSGGNENSTFLLSMSYLNQDGIVKGSKDKFERFTIRLNSDHKINNWLKVGNTLSYTNSERAALNENAGEFGGVIPGALMIDPTTPVEYTDGVPAHVQTLINGGNKLLKSPSGNYYGVSQYVMGEIVNPFVVLDITNGKTRQDNILGNVYAILSPFKGFSFTSRFNLDLRFQNLHFWNPTYYYTSERNNSSTVVSDNNDRYQTWSWENFASYNKAFGDHNLTVMAGMSAEQYNHRFTNAQGGPMISELGSYSELDYITGQTNDRVNGRLQENKKVSYFGRLSYDYKNKYLLQGSIRRDGAATSQLPEDGTWGIFPSFSAGWVISNEDFFPQTAISHLKVRGSWGKNGSLSNLGDYGYASLVSSTSSGYALVYPVPGGYATVSEPSQLENPDLTWETSVQTDFGVDIRAFNDKLSFTVDYYIKKTTDLITQNTPALEAGNNASPINAGDIENKGFEFDLGYKNSIGELKYSINGNLSTLKNEVTYLNPTLSRLNGANIGPGGSWTATAFEKGQPVWYFRGYKTAGIDPNTGNPNFVDKNGNISASVNENDKQFIGSPIPKLMFGGNISLEYKGFDFSAQVQGQSGNKVLIGWIRNDRPTINMPKELTDNRWSSSNNGGSNPKAGADPKTWNSDMLIFSGNYLRVKQIQLGYSISPDILKTIKFSSLRAYVSLEDFFTFTQYPGMDPEVGSNNGNNNNYGIDRGSYPIAKKIMFGVSLSF